MKRNLIMLSATAIVMALAVTAHGATGSSIWFHVDTTDKCDFKICLHGNGGVLDVDGELVTEVVTNEFNYNDRQMLPKFKRGSNKLLGWQLGTAVFDWTGENYKGEPYRAEEKLIPDQDEIIWSESYIRDYAEHGEAWLDDDGVMVVHLYAIWTTTVSFEFYNQNDKSIEPEDLGNKLSWGYYDVDKRSSTSDAPPRTWCRHGASAELYPGKHLIAFKIEDGYDWLVNVENVKNENINVDSQVQQIFYTPGTTYRSVYYYNVDYVQGAKLGAKVRFVYGCEGGQTLHGINVPFFDPSKVSIAVYPFVSTSGTADGLKMGTDEVSLPEGDYIAYVSYERDSLDVYWTAMLSEVKFRVKASDGLVTIPINFALMGTTVLDREWACVKFDARSGSVPVGEMQYPKATNGGSAIINQLPEAKREGFSFLGWWTKPSNLFGTGRRVEIGDAIDSCTLYARWELLTTTGVLTSFDPAGDDIIVLSQTIEFISANAFELAGNVKEVVFEGDAPQLEEGALDGLSSDCTIRVSPQSSGWGVTIPGTWNGFRIEYINEEPVTVAVFTVEDGVLTAVELNGATEVVVPDDVTSIGEGAFSGLDLTKVTIGSGVTDINAYAFDGCSSLVEIAVDSGNPAFCSKNGMLLTKDGKTLVHGVNGDVVIPSGVVVIGDSAFYGCGGLTSVTIPNSVTTIEYYAFDYCGSLVEIAVDSGNPAFCSKNGMLLTKDGKTLVHGVNGDVVIPSGVVVIGDSAFYGCSGLTNITVPNSVTTLENYAFGECVGLKGVAIPDSVTSIGVGAFYCCDGIESVRFCGDALVLGLHAFYEVPSDCIIYVEKGSTGWGVDIPGTWNDFRIVYADDISQYDVGDVFNIRNTCTNAEIWDDAAVNECNLDFMIPASDKLPEGAKVRIRKIRFASLNRSFTGWDMAGNKSDPYYVRLNGVNSDLYEFGGTIASNEMTEDNALTYTFSTPCEIIVGKRYPAVTGNNVGVVGNGVAFLYSNGKLVYGSGADRGSVRYVKAGDSRDVMTTTTAAGITGEAGYCPVYEIEAEVVSLETSALDVPAFEYTATSANHTITGIADGWFKGATVFHGETPQNTNLRLGPGEDFGFVLQTTADTNPYYAVDARTDAFSFALYADISAVPLSGKAVLLEFGYNGSQMAMLYKEGDKVRFGICSMSEVIGTAAQVDARDGYHLYVGVCDPSTGAVSLSIDGGNASEGGAGTAVSLGGGFQIGSIYNGMWYDNYNNYVAGVNMAIVRLLGYDEALSYEDAAVLAALYPAVEPVERTVDKSNLPVGTITVSSGQTLNLRLTTAQERNGCEVSSITVSDGGAIRFVAADGSVIESSRVSEVNGVYSIAGTVIPALPADASLGEIVNVLAGSADAVRLTENLDTVSEYNAYHAWANRLGASAVKANEHAAAAYLLGAERLFENEPTVEISELAIEERSSGTLAPAMIVAVTVKDGESAVTVSAEKVAAMFEATDNLGDWNGAAKLTPMVKTSGTDASGKMTFVVTPGDGTATKAFLRIKR